MRKSQGMPKPDKLLSSAEVCDLLHIDRSTLSRWVAAGRIKPAHQLPGRTGAFLFYGSDVSALAKAMAA